MARRDTDGLALVLGDAGSDVKAHGELGFDHAVQAEGKEVHPERVASYGTSGCDTCHAALWRRRIAATVGRGECVRTEYSPGAVCSDSGCGEGTAKTAIERGRRIRAISSLLPHVYGYRCGTAVP